MSEEAQSSLLAALRSDPREAALAEPLSEADLVMLDYALKLTRTPGEMNRADVDALRAVGFDDRGVHDLCAIVGYFAFVNRIADGLGVELE